MSMGQDGWVQSGLGTHSVIGLSAFEALTIALGRLMASAGMMKRAVTKERSRRLRKLIAAIIVSRLFLTVTEEMEAGDEMRECILEKSTVVRK